MGEMGGHGWGWFGGGSVFMLLFWVVLILAAAALIKWLFGKSSTPNRSRDKTPLEILKERYARGELNPEEFEQRRRDLER